MEVRQSDVIHQRNIMMLKILWGFLAADITLNLLNNYIEAVEKILFISSFPIVLLTTLVLKRKSVKVTMYLLSISFLGVLLFINFEQIHYINILFLFLPPIFSLLYREWINIIFNVIGSILIFLFVVFKNGNHYFIGWENSDVFYFIILFSVLGVIAIVESKFSENIRKRLTNELIEMDDLQKQLARNEKYYRSLVKQSGEGIFVFNIETQKIVEANQHICEMLGYSEDELLKLSLPDIAHYDSSIVQKNIQAVLDKKVHDLGQRKYKGKGEIVIDVEVSASFIQTEDEQVILANVRDISDKIKRDNELKMAKSVLDCILEGAMVTDLHGKIIYVNPSFEEITGFKLKEVIGKTPSVLKSYKHNQEFYDLIWQDVEKNGSWEGEILNKKKSGGLYIQRTQIHSIKNDKNEIILYSSVFRDITEEKNMFYKLEENEQKYRSLFENNQGISFVLDTNGHITDVNGHALTITGYKKLDLVGSSLIPLLNKEDVTKTLDAFDRIMQGESLNFETRFIDRIGDILELSIMAAPIFVDKEIVGLIGMAQNITQQKQSERDLIKSEKRYRSLIELYPEVVFVHSQDKIEFINDKALDFIGATHEAEIIGKPVYEFLHPEDRKDAAYRLMMRFQDHQVHNDSNELRFIKKDGSIITAEVSGSVIEYNNQPALLGVIRDITAKKEAETKLKEANDILEKLSKLDGLTGIPNRRFFDETLDLEWHRAKQSRSPISLIMLDIDCFKSYNDTYGHKQGDECLKTVANALKASLNRSDDFIARYGGEEFSVILPHTDTAGAMAVGEILRAKIESLNIPNIHSSVKPSLTISLGVSTIVPKMTTNTNLLIEQADQALYKSKGLGRNRITAYDQDVLHSLN